MIKFFRKIRYSLISGTNMGKYLRYAIGEILLVVIGILIALQINNYHQSQLRLKQERVLLQQLKIELLEVFEDVFSDLIDLKRGERSHFEMLDAIENDRPYADTMAFDFYFIKLDEYIYPNKAVYDKIKEIGLDIIKNDSLRNDIQLLYEHTFPRISKSNSFTRDIGAYLDNYYVDNFSPNNNYDVSISIPPEIDSLSGRIYRSRPYEFPQEFEVHKINRRFNLGFIPNDFEALKTDKRFLMLLREADRNRDYKIWRYEEARDMIRQMVEMIDSILRED